jgi:2-keto-4-pentenoate hydratase/2-oxohepta-3-ene-1,7-dioic acid hydratase in catechol pathway
MKIVRLLDGKKPEYGILNGDVIDGIEGTPYRQFRYSNHHYNLSEVKLLASCVPSKIVALGLNYKQHGQEMHMNLPEEPLLFLKPSTAVIGPEDEIIYPPSSHRVDYEGELGAVIKTKASHVPVEKAMSYVLGYTCFNDVTARDLQKKDTQWTRAKGFDTFAAFGPCIETEVDPRDLNIESYINGQLKQKGNTKDLIFNVAQLVSFISNVMTLLPGDVIATGTPEGVGPMQPGDIVEIKIEGIGVLRNKVVKN